MKEKPNYRINSNFQVRSLLMKKIFILGIVLLAAIPLMANTGGSKKLAAGVELCSSTGILEYNIDVPSYDLITLQNGDIRIKMDNVGYSMIAGYPMLPMPTYTFALPPGTEITDVEVVANRMPLEGTYTIEAALPSLPLSASSEEISKYYELYEKNKQRVYSGAEKLSDAVGQEYAKGERREYSLATVALHPFYYEPSTGKLSFAKTITIRIHYAPVNAKHAEFVSRFINAGTIEADVPQDVYNKDQARKWYKPSARLLANKKMLIITLDKLKSVIEDYVSWRKSTGFDVDVVTVETIAAQGTGVDLPQKIRYYLRDNASDYQYLLIIGHFANIPARMLTCFNNNNPPEYYKDLSSIPSDIYYGDLSKDDPGSWNKDGDNYYGEALNNSTPPGVDMQDAPDIEMELHVGRINTSYSTKVTAILKKTWLFENNKDDAYKKSAVMAGGILWYPNRDGRGGPGYDGAHMMEFLQTNKIVDDKLAYTMYEKEGNGPSQYACDTPFTNKNLIAALNQPNHGLFFENNHGSKNSFARMVWKDDGDGVPREKGNNRDVDGVVALSSGDVYKLNDNTPNVAFLMSCLNGHLESANCLAQALLNKGSVAVVAHTRSALGREGWSGPGQGGQNALYYYVSNNYLKNTAYDNVIGDAVDAGRLQYYHSEGSASMRFINTYEHTLFGDPALRHFGRDGTIPSGGVEDNSFVLKPSLALEVSSNYTVNFSIPTFEDITIKVWDVAGRKVATLAEGKLTAGSHSLNWDTHNLASGSYFITLQTENNTTTTKAVVIR